MILDFFRLINSLIKVIIKSKLGFILMFEETGFFYFPMAVFIICVNVNKNSFIGRIFSLHTAKGDVSEDELWGILLESISMYKISQQN